MSDVIDLNLLRQFCSSNRHALAEPFLSYNYRGPRAVNYDTCATDGRVLLCVHGVMPDGVSELKVPLDLPASIWWAMSAIARGEPEVTAATQAAISRIPGDVLGRLHMLPGLEFVFVKKVRVTVSGRRTRQRWEKIDQNGMVYFRWAGGVGVTVANQLDGTASGATKEVRP